MMRGVNRHRVAQWLGLADDGASRKTQLVSSVVVAVPMVIGAIAWGYWGMFGGACIGAVLGTIWRWKEPDPT
jgi:hypothetical protein